MTEFQAFGTDNLYEANDLGTFMRSVVNYVGSVQSVNAALPKLGAAVLHAMSDAKCDVGHFGQCDALQSNV